MLKQNLSIIRTNGVDFIDEADKTVLIGITRLTKGTSQDKILRKLYPYSNGKYEEIEEFIRLLKKNNTTLAWTSEDNRYKAVEIQQLISPLEF